MSRQPPELQDLASHMRHIGSLSDQTQAERLDAYLIVESIRATIEPEGDEWAVWIHNEDQMDLAREEFKKFNADPDAGCYLDAVMTADGIRKAKERAAKKAAKKVQTRDSWEQPDGRQCPITFALIALSVATVVLTTDWQASDLRRFVAKESSIIGKLRITEYDVVGNMIRWTPGLPEVMAGEVWRLVTPIFIHMSALHILFNMYWTRQFGITIEFHRGKFRFLMLVLFIAITSNFAQYWMSAPSFGGMSGVGYGLFGYLWVKSKYDRRSEFRMPPNLAMWFMIWLVVCMTGAVGPIANWAHGIGLLAGALVAIMPVWWRKVVH